MEPEVVVVTVKPGDTLSSIAREHFNGDASKWHEIFWTNAKDFVQRHKDRPDAIGPNMIWPGEKISIIKGVNLGPDGKP